MVIFPPLKMIRKLGTIGDEERMPSPNCRQHVAVLPAQLLPGTAIKAILDFQRSPPMKNLKYFFYFLISSLGSIAGIRVKTQKR